MNGEKPPDWDWVKERYECSIERAFQRLRLHAKVNVDTKNSQSPDRTYALESVRDAFTVLIQGRQNETVHFMLNGAVITIRGAGVNVDLTVTLTLTDAGDCRFKLKDGSELTEWQVLKRALEDLFFNV